MRKTLIATALLGSMAFMVPALARYDDTSSTDATNTNTDVQGTTDDEADTTTTNTNDETINFTNSGDTDPSDNTGVSDDATTETDQSSTTLPEELPETGGGWAASSL